jgi:hypothetical protein
MPPPSDRRCSTCELLVRSGTPGLETYGKCPHRSGWVRTHDPACAAHQGERSTLLVRVTMALNVLVCALSLALLVVYDVREGNLVTHLMLGAVLLTVAVFLWVVRRYDLLSEEPKYDLLEPSDPPPEEDRDPPWWLDDR